MRNRNIRIWARVTDDEYNIITKRVKKTGLSREAYIRSLLLGYAPKEKPDARFYEVMRELSAIGNNLKSACPKSCCT